jgi:glycosyltransferase involved in cell wall biosynthesis
LYEAIAAKTPFLASNVGNSVEIASWTEGGAIFPTEIKFGRSEIKRDESVSLLESWCNDDNLRAAQAEKAYLNWKERFTWEKIIDTYLSSFKSIID